MTSSVNRGVFIQQNITFSEDPEQFLLQITKDHRDIANAVNARDISIYNLIEEQNGQLWFNTNVPTIGNPIRFRNGFRTVYNLNAGNLVAAHGISNFSSLTFTRIYGTGTDGTIWYPLPYVDTVSVTNQIKVFVDSVNYNVVRGAGAPALTSGVLVLDYLKY